jgi:UDP-N-acetylmuramate-alanine ligase
MPKVNLSVSVDDKHLDNFDEIVKKIKKAGMKVEQKLDSLGIITGSIDSSKVDALREVDGVLHVEEQKKIQIPPPDSPVQ